MGSRIERGQWLDPAGAATVPPPATVAPVPPLPRSLMVPKGPPRDPGTATVALTCDECGDRFCPVWAALALERPTRAEVERAHRVYAAGIAEGERRTRIASPRPPADTSWVSTETVGTGSVPGWIVLFAGVVVLVLAGFGVWAVLHG